MARIAGGALAAAAGEKHRSRRSEPELVLRDRQAEPAGADDTARSLAAGERQDAFTPDTICDGLRTLIGAPNFELLRAASAEVIVVDDAATMAAMRLLWEVLKQVVEPSSATVLAAVLAQPQRFSGLRVGLVLSGGNVDLPALRWGSP